MEYSIQPSRMRISELLALSPLIVPALIELRVDCIGCPMNRFCTIATLCHQYELDADKVAAMIQTKLDPEV
jgi:hypothetical protein